MPELRTAASFRRRPMTVHDDVRSSSTWPAGPITPRPWVTTSPTRFTAVHLVWALLLASTIPWRKGVYYDGGTDSVVLGKAALGLLALVLAAALARGTVRTMRVPVSPILLMVAYLVVSVVGAYANGSLVPSAVLAVRVLILMATVILLFSRYPTMVVARSLVQVIAVVTIVASVTGLPSAARGRMQGGLPPLNPNELALMASVCLVWIFAKMLQARESRTDLLLAAGATGVVLLTGSRSSLAALCVAVVFMACRATALTPRSFAVTSLLAPVIAYVAFGTDVLSSVFLRGGSQGVSTLSNRTIAWDAALTRDIDPWQTWLGAGLAQKKISVPGQWWNTQLLDSSWISALVQVGLIGLILVLFLVVSTALRSLFAPRRMGALWLGLVVLLASRAFLESGLFDSTTAFAVFFVTVLAIRTQRAETSAGEPRLELAGVGVGGGRGDLDPAGPGRRRPAAG